MNQAPKNPLLDVIEYASSLGVMALLFVAARNYFYTGGNEMVLGTTTLVSDAPALPEWLYMVLIGLIIMAILVLITVVLSAATVRKMKRS